MENRYPRNIYFQKCVSEGLVEDEVSDAIRESASILSKEYFFNAEDYLSPEYTEKYIYIFPKGTMLQKYMIPFTNIKQSRDKFANFFFEGYSICFFLNSSISEEQVREYINIVKLPMFFIIMKSVIPVKEALYDLYDKMEVKLEYIFESQNSKEESNILYNMLYDELSLYIKSRIDSNMQKEIRDVVRKEKISTIEIEWRFGYEENSHFSGHVHMQDWNEIKQMLDRKKINSKKLESTVYRYTIDGDDVRVITGDGASTYKKTRVLPHFDIPINDSDTILRLGVSREDKLIVPISASKLKSPKISTRIRYVYRPNDFFEIHLSEIKSKAPNSTLETLEYQAEIELLNNNVDPNICLEFFYPWLIKKIKKNAEKKQSMKQLNVQVLPLTRQTKINMTDFCISPKLDGERTLVYIQKKGSTTTLSTLNSKCYNFIVNPTEPVGTCIFDAEEYEGIFHVFDVLFYNNKSLLSLPYIERIKYIKNVLNLNTMLVSEKPIKEITNIQQDIIWASVYENKKTDGWVLTNKFKNYDDSQIYKYKPLEYQTIDFLIKELGGKYYLFCGIKCEYIKTSLPSFYKILFPSYNCNDKNNYVPYIFYTEKYPELFVWKNADSEKIFDGKIGEFRWNGSNWVIVRERTDRENDLDSKKYFGNDYKTVASTWELIQNPITIENIVSIFNKEGVSKEGVSGEEKYFINRSGLQEFNRKFNSSVKAHLFKKYFRNAELVIDLCAGEGNDLVKFSDVGVKEVLALELNQAAIDEMIKRYGALKESRNLQMVLETKQVNLTLPYDKLELIIDNRRTSKMNCSFALHYLIPTREACINIAKFVSRTLNSGGYFLITVLNGAKIFKLLKRTQGEYIVNVNTPTGIKPKYNIKALYNINEKMENFGQYIEVLLPFSDGTLVKEPLTNIEAVINVFQEEQLDVESTGSFAKYAYLADDNKLKRFNPTPEDIDYVSLYSYVVFKKR